MLFGLEEGVEGEKGAAAIHDASFSYPASGASEGFELLLPKFLAEGERGAVFFATMKVEASFFCPCKSVPVFSKEARKEALVGEVKLGPSVMGPTISELACDDGFEEAAEKTAPATRPAAASTATGEAASSALAAKEGAPCPSAGWAGHGKTAPALIAGGGDAGGEDAADGIGPAAAAPGGGESAAAAIPGSAQATASGAAAKIS
jgi:hypothetical protein